MLCVLRLANAGFMQCFYLRFPSPFARVYLFCPCASPRKHRVCTVLLSSAPSPFAHVYLLICQCASPRKHRVCVALPFCTRLFMSVCFASQTPGLCCAVSSLPYKFVRFYALFVLYNRVCVAHFALQASGLLGPKPKFLFWLCCFLKFFVMLTLPRKFRFCPVLFPQRPFLISSRMFFNVFFVRVSSPEHRFVEFSSVPRFQVLILHALDFVAS